MEFKLIVVLLLVHHSSLTTGSVTLCQDAIWREIMPNYIKETPPLPPGKPIIVKIKMSLIDILGLTETDESLTTSWLARTEWIDPRLIWDPSDFDGCNVISLPGHAIWLPDIIIFNNQDSDSITSRQLYDYRYRVTVKYDGSVCWMTPGIVTTGCNLDVTYFPFDFQSCYLHHQSVSLPNDFMRLLSDPSAFTTSEFSGNEEWQLIGKDVLTGNQSDLSYVRFYLNLRRKPFYFVMNVAAPIILLSALTLIVFWLPPEAEEKMSLSITLVLSFTVFALLVFDSLPQTSESAPLLGIYSFLATILAAMTVIASVMVLRAFHKDPRTVPSQWVTKSCRTMAYVMYMKEPTTITSTGQHHVESKADEKVTNEKTGQMVPNNYHLNNNGAQPHRTPLSQKDPNIIGLAARPVSIKIEKQTINVLSNTKATKYGTEKLDKQEPPVDWLFVSEVLDRLFFWLFLVLYLLLNFTYLWWYPLGSKLVKDLD